MADFVTKDSGKRQEFETGAVRDTADDKPRLVLIPPTALRRLGMVYLRGEKKYSARNWEKGMPYSRFLDSALRHLNSYIEGKRDEDHLSQAVFNIFAIIHFEETGRTELDDLPRYIQDEES